MTKPRGLLGVLGGGAVEFTRSEAVPQAKGGEDPVVGRAPCHHPEEHRGRGSSLQGGPGKARGGGVHGGARATAATLLP